jgi:hypothetical protein
LDRIARCDRKVPFPSDREAQASIWMMMMRSFLLQSSSLSVVSSLLLCVALFPTTQCDALRFALINGNSDFFAPIASGFFKRCQELGIEAVNRTNTKVRGNSTATIDATEHIEQLIDDEYEDILYGYEGPIDGIAFEPWLEGIEGRDERLVELVQEAYDRGIPSVTIDGDIENSTRVAYVGTDQEFMGATMARTGRQLVPDGGTYAIIHGKEGRDEGLMNELSRFEDENGNKLWTLVNLTFDDVEELKNYCEVTYDLRRDHRKCYMEMYAEANVTAMFFMRASK